MSEHGELWPRDLTAFGVRLTVVSLYKHHLMKRGKRKGIGYRIAVNFRGRNFRGSEGSENFAEKTFTDCLKPIIGGCDTPQNFVEKTFADGPQTSKSAKVFSLESFPLYGMRPAIDPAPTQRHFPCMQAYDRTNEGS